MEASPTAKISGTAVWSIGSRLSTTVTWVPGAADFDAPSMPITPAHYDHRAGHPLHPQHAVEVEHVVIVELDLCRPGRPRAGGDHDLLGGAGGAVATAQSFQSWAATR